MTVYPSYTVNPKDGTYAAAVHNIDGMKFMKDSYCMDMPDERHQRGCVKMIRDEEGVEWVPDQQRIHYTFQVDGESVSLGQAKKLSKIENKSTVTVTCEATFTGMMQSQLSYVQGLKEQYVVRVVKA